MLPAATTWWRVQCQEVRLDQSCLPLVLGWWVGSQWLLKKLFWQHFLFGPPCTKTQPKWRMFGMMDWRLSQELFKWVIHTKAGALGLFELAPDTPITFTFSMQCLMKCSWQLKICRIVEIILIYLVQVWVDQRLWECEVMRSVESVASVKIEDDISSSDIL